MGQHWSNAEVQQSLSTEKQGFQMLPTQCTSEFFSNQGSQRQLNHTQSKLKFLFVCYRRTCDKIEVSNRDKARCSPFGPEKSLVRVKKGSEKLQFQTNPRLSFAFLFSLSKIKQGPSLSFMPYQCSSETLAHSKQCTFQAVSSRQLKQPC